MTTEQITTIAAEKGVTLTETDAEFIKGAIEALPKFAEAMGRVIRDLIDIVREAAKIFAEFIGKLFGGYFRACELYPKWAEHAQNSKWRFIRWRYTRKLWKVAMRI